MDPAPSSGTTFSQCLGSLSNFLPGTNQDAKIYCLINLYTIHRYQEERNAELTGSQCEARFWLSDGGRLRPECS